MNEPDPQAEAVHSTLDDEIGVILEQYLQQLERGEPVSREDLLAQHPQIADRLAACLDGIALFGVGGGARERAAGQPPSGTPESIGDYEVLRELGRGGMGVVYEAREKSLDRIVALKVMRFGIVDPRALERFQREAETAGALHHTNIVPVYATGREGDTSWYAMQRIDGESLGHRIARAYQEGGGPISVEEILRVGIQAAEALDHAHQREVIHRDVKPANLIVDREERVWLTDFGLARRLVDVGATLTGAILGTPRYMSPEQADLKRVEVDHRTDVYSLGATLYEMTTGRPPFESDDPLKVIGQIRYDDPPSARSLRPDLPRDLDVVLSKCMEKEASQRYAAASELAEDLRAIRDDRAIRARAISILERLARWTRKHQPRLRVAAITVLATAATILLAIVGWQGWHTSTLGSFRLRAAGGPYMTSIHPVGESNLSKSAVKLTVPMQQHQQLPIGDYDMLLAPRGRWSQTLRLPVSGGMPTEYRLRSKPTDAREISMAGTCPTPVAGFDEPAVLLSHDGQLRRMTLSGDNDWTLDVSRVETVYTILPGLDVESDDTIRQVNFANTAPLVDEPRGRAMLHQAPHLSAPQLALRTAIDLDGDGKADSLVSAVDKSALLAVDAHGLILWARSYDLNGVSLAGNPAQPPRQPIVRSYPGILSLHDVGDRDGDGIHDIAALMVHIQPGTQNDVCIAAISGQTGEPLQAIHPRALKVADSSLWPHDGVLHVGKAAAQGRSGLTFTAAGVRRKSSSVTTSVYWGSGAGQVVTFALPSPLQIVSQGERLVAIYHAGTQCRRFDLDSGAEIGSAITLPFTPATGGSIARLNDGAYALIFHDRDSRSQKTPSGFRQAARVVAYDLHGNLLWERFAEHADWGRLTWLKNKVDWPLAGDSNGDGRDELLLPSARGLAGEDVGIEMLDPASGAPIWRTAGRQQLFNTAERCLHRIALSSDVDGDGWRDWVTASIAGPPVPLVDRRVVAAIGDAYVYVDWISGKSGESLAWARHPIPVVSDTIDVAEIDAIRCGIPTGETGTVEVDFVTGDKGPDAQLESMVLRFHPSSPDAIKVAAGLDVVGVADPAASLAGTPTRVYRMRPGPYVEGPDRLVLLSEGSEQGLRLGEGQVIATWQGSSGRQLVAVHGFEPPRFSVIDADTQKTLWSTRRDNLQSPRFTPIEDDAGHTDFLVQWKAGENDEPPTLISGESGRSRWTMSATPGGQVTDARFVSKKWLLVVGDGQVPQRLKPPHAPDAFKMSLVHLASGKVRWSKHFLHGAARSSFPGKFHDLRLADINGDSFADVIGLDQAQFRQAPVLAVWDGATGERLWTQPLFATGLTREYFMPFCVVTSSDLPVIAYVGPDSRRQTRGDVSLIVRDAITGTPLFVKRLEDSKRLLQSRDSIYQRLALADCSTAHDRPRIGLLRYDDNEPTPRWTLFEVRGNSVSEAMSWQPEPPLHASGLGVWLHDVTGDSVPERFVATQIPGRRHYRYLARYETDADEPTWEVAVDSTYSPRLVWRDDSGFPVAYWQVSPTGFACIDLTAGRVLATFDNPSLARGNLPRVTAVRQIEDHTAIRLASPSPDGLVSRWLGKAPNRPRGTKLHGEFDPRRIKRLMSHVGAPNGLQQMLVDSGKAVAALAALVIIPLAYFGTMIRRRQWSLSWLMLAPPVVLLFLVVGRAGWTHEPSLLANLLSGTGWLLSLSAIVVALREREPHHLLAGKSWIVILLGTVMAFTATFTGEFSQATDPTIRYIFAWQDAAQLFIISVGATGYVYWLLRLTHAAARRFATRSGGARA